MSETINRLKNIEIGCVYIGELDKRGDELKAEIQRLSNWITQLIGCDWCMIKECFYSQEESIHSLFNILLDETICNEFDAYYYDEKDKHILVKYASVLSKSLKYISVQNDFFHFYIKHITKHLNILNFKYDLELPICHCQNKCITNMSDYCNDCYVVKSANTEFNSFMEQYNVAPDTDYFVNDWKIKANEKFEILYKEKIIEENLYPSQFDYKNWNMLYYSWYKISEFCQSKIKTEIKELKHKTYNETNHNIKKPKEFSDFLLVKDKDNFIEEIKVRFYYCKGINLRAIINYFLDNNMIMIPERENKKFYLALKNVFSHDIGSYNSIFDKIKPDKSHLEKLINSLEELKIKFS